MYIRDGQQAPNPDGTSGLYIRRQDGTTVQVRVPAGHIAFQMGEAMQACPLSKHSKSDVRLHFSLEYCVDCMSPGPCMPSTWLSEGELLQQRQICWWPDLSTGRQVQSASLAAPLSGRQQWFKRAVLSCIRSRCA